MERDGNKQIDRLPLTPKNGGARILGKKFQDAVLSFINACRLTKFTIQLKDGSTVGRVIQADIKSTALGGTQVTIPLEISAAGSGSASVQQFKIVSDGGDYWNCKTWDGTTLGSDTVKVAKPYKLRAGTGKIASEVIRGVTYTYTYTAVTVGAVTGYYTRAVSGSDGSSETNYTIPDPIANDIIYGITFSTTTPSTLSAVTWLDINADGRAWAQ